MQNDVILCSPGEKLKQRGKKGGNEAIKGCIYGQDEEGYPHYHESILSVEVGIVCIVMTDKEDSYHIRPRRRTRQAVSVSHVTPLLERESHLQLKA